MRADNDDGSYPHANHRLAPMLAIVHADRRCREVTVADEPYTPFAKRAPRRSPPPGEPVWTLGKAGRRIACELRDDGIYGCEAQLLRDGTFYAGRRLDGARVWFLAVQALDHNPNLLFD